jgi:chromosome segregation ATPase
LSTILILLLVLSFIKLKKLQKNYNLLSDAEKIDKHFKKYHFRFNKRDLKDRIDEIYKEYISLIEEIKKKESHSELLQKQFNQIQKENEKFNSTNQDLNSKLLSSENQVSNNQKFIQNLELNIQTLNSDLEKEKQLQKEIQNISILLIEKFNNKSFEIQELASQESLDEAKKSYLKALIFMTFQSKSLIKKINESDSKYDSMNIDLLYDKIVKANKIITSNVKYDDVDPLVYITLKLFKDYKINGINDVFFNGD